MKAVLPGKICSRKSDLPEGAGDGVAIGDVQHQKRLAQTGERVELRTRANKCGI